MKLKYIYFIVSPASFVSLEIKKYCKHNIYQILKLFITNYTKMDKVESGNPRKKILRQTVSAILLEKGIDRADEDVLETLTEMLGSRKFYCL